MKMMEDRSDVRGTIKVSEESGSEMKFPTCSSDSCSSKRDPAFSSRTPVQVLNLLSNHEHMLKARSKNVLCENV